MEKVKRAKDIIHRTQLRKLSTGGEGYLKKIESSLWLEREWPLHFDHEFAFSWRSSERQNHSQK